MSQRLVPLTLFDAGAYADKVFGVYYFGRWKLFPRYSGRDKPSQTTRLVLR